MSFLRLNKVAAPNTPATGKTAFYLANMTVPHLRSIDENGVNLAVSRLVSSNYSTTSQSVPVARTYLAGSQLIIPPTGLQIGTRLHFGFSFTKTGAGSASSTIDIAFGTAGTVADTAQVSFVKPAGTAAGDEGWNWVEAIVRGPLSASGVVAGEYIMVHNLAATGHAQIPCVVVNTVSSAFDVRYAAAPYVGLCLTPGASDVITVQNVYAELIAA